MKILPKTHWRDVYLDDGRLEIDNNRSERAVKPFVIGRKNWLFAGNHHGAIAGANLLSLIETAKIHGLNPYNYLQYLFTKFPNAKTLEQLEGLLPYHCKGVLLGQSHLNFRQIAD